MHNKGLDIVIKPYGKTLEELIRRSLAYDGWRLRIYDKPEFTGAVAGARGYCDHNSETIHICGRGSNLCHLLLHEYAHFLQDGWEWSDNLLEGYEQYSRLACKLNVGKLRWACWKEVIEFEYRTDRAAIDLGIGYGLDTTGWWKLANGYAVRLKTLFKTGKLISRRSAIRCCEDKELTRRELFAI